jgi:hypothetical protein
VTTSHFKRWIWWWFRTFLILDEFQQFLCKSSSMDDIYNSNHTTVKKGLPMICYGPISPCSQLTLICTRCQESNPVLKQFLMVWNIFIQ